MPFFFLGGLVALFILGSYPMPIFWECQRLGEVGGELQGRRAGRKAAEKSGRGRAFAQVLGHGRGKQAAPYGGLAASRTRCRKRMGEPSKSNFSRRRFSRKRSKLKCNLRGLIGEEDERWRRGRGLRDVENFHAARGRRGAAARSTFASQRFSSPVEMRRRRARRRDRSKRREDGCAGR